ncbi:MAG: helix-turn-helix transcriptional regulator [Flavobacterium sp.]|uniref:helix-turn-helix domain-containing protein n=1 Tax=Flavobacterium sp. TaxID=239 RepID=UPI0032676D48
MNTTTKPKHIGRNISRIRELRGMKQEALAMAIGVSQQTISNIEGSETIDDDKLQLIAKELGVSAEAIKGFSEDVVFQIIGNTYNDNASSINYGCTFNPIDKLIEAYEENKKLYERLLEAEKKK